MLYTDLLMSINSEIIEYLEDGKLATIREISQHIKLRRSTVESALRTMASANTIIRHDRAVGTRPFLKYSLPQIAPAEVP